MNKKASLNLSIEAIVIVVIAFTVLGLGLAFVKSQIGDIGDTSKKVQSEIKEKILEDLRSSGKKLSIAQEIKLERGKETLESAGVVNTGISTDKFGIKVIPVKKKSLDGVDGTAAEMANEITFFYLETLEKELSPTAGDVIPITIRASASASGDYLYKLEAYQESNCPDLSATCKPYDTRSFFVKVR